MNKVVIVTHGDLAYGLYNSTKMIVGDIDRVIPIGLQPKDTPEEFKARLYKELDTSVGDKYLVLIDLVCGTPFNSLIDKMRDEHIEVVVGVNLPMLLEVVLHLDIDLKDLALLAEDTGHKGIITKEKFIISDYSEAEEDEI